MGHCFTKKKTLEFDGLINIDDIRRAFGDFHLLGDGGSSNVFRVVRREDRKEFSLKKMSKKNRKTVDLFQTEAEILESLDHPHIVKFEEVYVDRKNYYIVTQLCHGGDLLNHIKEKYSGDSKSKFTESFVAHLINQIVDSIGHCHSKNIVHRDIKPENFVFLERDSYSRLILIDFGIAKVVEQGKSYTDLVGTPYYIAPEYLTRLERTADDLKATDIWSIGVVAYVLCTGKPPFNGNTNEEVFRKIISKQLKFPRKARLSAKGKRIIKKILHKEAELRPTAEELKTFSWLNGGAEQNDLDVVQGIISFDLKTKMRRVVNRIVKESVKESDDEIRELFIGIDKNGDGLIDLEELKIFLKSSGYASCTLDSKAQEIMDKLDVDKDGELSIREFEEAWVHFQLSHDEKLMASLFDFFDKNGDGIIDSGEMKMIFGENSEDMTKAFEVFDGDKNGELSFQEFTKAMISLGCLQNTDSVANTFNFSLFALDQVQVDFGSDYSTSNYLDIPLTATMEKQLNNVIVNAANLEF